MTGRKTGCNRSRPVFFGFSIFRQTLQLATEKIQNLCNRNWWSGLLQLGSVQFRSFFQSSELDLRTLVSPSQMSLGKRRHSIWCHHPRSTSSSSTITILHDNPCRCLTTLPTTATAHNHRQPPTTNTTCTITWQQHRNTTSPAPTAERAGR